MYIYLYISVINYDFDVINVYNVCYSMYVPTILYFCMVAAIYAGCILFVYVQMLMHIYIHACVHTHIRIYVYVYLHKIYIFVLFVCSISNKAWSSFQSSDPTK